MRSAAARDQDHSAYIPGHGGTRLPTVRFSGRTYPKLAPIVRVLCAVAGCCWLPSYERKDAGTEDTGPLRAVTGGVVPLPLCGTLRLPRCRCLSCLLACQTALTPSANPPGKPGLHHVHLPLLHGRAMASQAGRVAAPPADPRLVMPANVSAQAQSRFQAYARTVSLGIGQIMPVDAGDQAIRGTGSSRD